MKRTKRLKFARNLAVALGLLTYSLSGQSIFTNPITGTNPSSTNPYTTGQTVNSNIIVSGIGRGPGVSQNAGNDRYNLTGWNTAFDINDYFEFVITPNSTYKIDFSSFVYTGQASSGITNFAFRSSLDGFTANIGSPATTGTTISLSAAQFQNITSAITFRLYGWGTGGTYSINGFTFNGTVSTAIVCTPPTTQASLFSTSNPTANTLDINWTRGNGSNVLVIAKQGSAVNQTPVNGTTYTANTGFGSGTSLTGGNFVVYDGTGSTATITGLLGSTTYYFAAYEYDNSTNCFTPSPLLGSGSTSCTAPNTSATSLIVGSTGSTTVAISWTNGSGTQRIVVAKEGSAVDFVPVNGTSYTANASFSQATDLGSGNKVVYNGTGNFTTIQGLEQGKSYHFAVFEANCAGQQYKITTPARNSVSTSTTTGTILSPGDMVLIGYDNTISGAIDKFVLSPLVDLVAGSSFSLVNATYELYTNANERTRQWRSCGFATPEIGEIASVKITINQAISKGSIICFETPGLGNAINNLSVNATAWTNGVQYTYSNNGSVTNSSINISTTNPDPIFIVQGDWVKDFSGNFATLDGRVLAGLQDGGLWYQSNQSTIGVTGQGSRRSRIPPEIECYAVQGNNTPGSYSSYYKLTSSLRTGAHPAILRNVVDFINNWINATPSGGDDLPSGTCNTTFTITGIATPGIWIGTGNTLVGRNWFDCRNWENLQVPDETIDVLIGPKANNNCEVDAAAPYSDNFNDTARCKNITIDNRELIIEGSANDIIKVSGNIDINATSGLDMSDGTAGTPDGQMYLYGNWLNQKDEVEFKQGESTIHFVGGNNQTITNLVSSNETFFNLTVNKTDSNINLVGTNDITIDPLGNVNFLNGLIISNKTNNSYVKFENTATATNASITSFVDGPVIKNTSNTNNFDFPIGDVVSETNYFRPLGIQPTTAVNTTFEGEYYFADYGDQTLGTNVSDVSTMEYWRLERNAGTAFPVVKLSWDLSSDIAGDLTTNYTDLLVASFDGSNWDSQGGTMHTGNISKGTVKSSAAVNQFGPFTLAVNISPTPVNIIDFNVVSKGNTDVLTWTVVENGDNSKYEIEKSLDGQTFYQIESLIPSKISRNETYQVNIANKSDVYYRLKQIDFDGKFIYSKVVYSSHEGNPPLQLLYTNESSLQYLGSEGELVYNLHIYSVLGETILNVEGNLAVINATLANRFEKLPKGLNIFKISNNENNLITKLLVK